MSDSTRSGQKGPRRRQVLYSGEASQSRRIESMETFSLGMRLDIEVFRESILSFGRTKHGETKSANNEWLCGCEESMVFRGSSSAQNR